LAQPDALGRLEPLRWVGVECNPFGRGVVAVVGGSEPVAAVVAENPDEFVGALDEPCAHEREAEPATKRHDAAEPGVEKLVHASRTDSVTS
jgi:hypothetical protein